MAGRMAITRLSRRILGSPSRVWGQTVSKSAAAQPAVEEDDDIVVSHFKTEEEKFRKFVAATKNIQIPLSGDAKAVEEYHKKMAGVRQKLDIPSSSARLQNIMQFQLQQCEDNVRSFIMSLEGTLGDQAFQTVLDALDKVEGETGSALTFGDNPPFKKFIDSVKGILTQHGISPESDPKKLALEEEVENINALRAGAQAEMEAAKTKHGLGFIKVDAGTLKATVGG